MERRAAGAGLVLLLAAALMAVTPVLLRPTRIDGNAVAAAMPEPPQIGDCLRADSTEVLVVSCDEPHSSEVTARWLADDPQRWLAANDDAYCAQAATSYLNFNLAVENGDWSVPFLTSWIRVDAPPAERIRARGWSVCAVTAAGGPYSGSLRSITVTDRPSATSSCLTGTPTSVVDVSCDEPHLIERLAYAYRIVPNSTGTAAPLNPDGSINPDGANVPQQIIDQLTEECAHIAATVLDTTDPTKGGLLRIKLTPGFYAVINRPGMAVATADCAIAPTSNRSLVGTLIGLGQEAVPFE